MPPLETMGRGQDAVLWPAAGEDRFGEVLLGDPVPVRVKWDWTRRVMRGPDGNPVVVDAVAVCDRRVEVGSLLRLGSIDDLPPGTDLSAEVSEAMQVVAYEETGAVKYRPAHVYRELGLSRTRDSLQEEAADQ